MKNYSEKRRDERKNSNEPVNLYKDDLRNQYYDAGLYNYSRGGMYLRTDEEMSPGQYVYVKIKNYDKDSTGPERYESYSGYVKWSKELGTSSPGGAYGYGIEYAEPVYY